MSETEAAIRDNLEPLRPMVERSAAIAQPPLRVHDSWRHQCQAFNFAFDRGASMLAMDMGTGKSKVVADLVANWGAGRVLILCPKSVLGVWRREFARHWPSGEVDADLCILDRRSGKEKAQEVESFLRGADTGTRVVVANYDAVWREPLATSILNAGFAVTVCDESHRIKAAGGKASRFCQKLGKQSRRTLCLTGTPMPHSPLDLYGQFRFLDTSVYGTSFARFRARYAVTNPMFPSQVRRWINQDELQEKFHGNAFVCRANEVLDLPEVQHLQRTCSLSPKARKVYQDIEGELLAELSSGRLIEPQNALVKLLRLQQVTSGFVGGQSEGGEGFVELLADDKQKLLLDLMADVSGPTVVFCRFRADLAAVGKVAAKLGKSYGELSSGRRDLTEHATMPEGIDLMGVQLQAGGVGIDLTRASYGVYYSIGFSLGDFEQSVARLHRPGQERPVTFYHLLAENTVDERVYQALDKRRDVVESVLHSYGDKG
ncbi:MAG: DEAD/DEAH box helicase [Planctomycetota bacterium]